MFETFEELSFLSDLASDLKNFELQREIVNDDFTVWNSIIITQLGRHAPIKHRRVKSVRLHDWYKSEIGQARKTGDKFKHSNSWPEFKRLRIKPAN